MSTPQEKEYAIDITMVSLKLFVGFIADYFIVTLIGVPLILAIALSVGYFAILGPTAIISSIVYETEESVSDAYPELPLNF